MDAVSDECNSTAEVFSASQNGACLSEENECVVYMLRSPVAGAPEEHNTQVQEAGGPAPRPAGAAAAPATPTRLLPPPSRSRKRRRDTSSSRSHGSRSGSSRSRASSSSECARRSRKHRRGTRRASRRRARSRSRPRHRRRRGAPRPRVRSSSSSGLDTRFEVLSQQLVSQLSDLVSANKENQLKPQEFLLPPQSNDEVCNLSISIKEPLVPAAPSHRVAKLVEHQHFNKSDWKSVRYADTQKKYLACPAFVHLKVNEELASLADESSSFINWPRMERSIAALSNAFLTQNEIVNSSLQNVIDWASKVNEPITASTLYTKMKEIFDKDSKYKLVSQDILQIICGKRNECIAARRGALLKLIGDKYISQGVDNIPPSSEYLFNPVMLAEYINKIGGIDKLKRVTVKYNTEPQPSTSRSGLSVFTSPTRQPARSARPLQSVHPVPPAHSAHPSYKPMPFRGFQAGGGDKKFYNKNKSHYNKLKKSYDK
ncbi:unnamed protein product [Plutella xylostella]|uniref:(diamondback moth) hypothetical protein n=1 Tax=Plutella xylostella TaxID=51655 RepID=A0A8S4G381_PLUXY|nr:unnamed protein product [Plutella xylostella]